MFFLGSAGGPWALVLNIYEDLLDSIRCFRWRFILPLAAGIGTGILLTARLFTYLLDQYPEFITSVLFGLILSSAFYTRREITRTNIYSIMSMALGMIAAAAVILLNQNSVIEVQQMGWRGIAVSGFLASISMLLPGISGATVLVLMGMYEYILTALTTFQVSVFYICYNIESFISRNAANGCILPQWKE